MHLHSLLILSGHSWLHKCEYGGQFLLNCEYIFQTACIQDGEGGQHQTPFLKSFTGILLDTPTLKPILSIRQACREAEAEAYYKSVPMLPPLLGIFPPIHPPIEACPDLPSPLFLAAITTGTCSTDGSPTLKEAIGRKKISKKLLLFIFSHFCCHLNQSDSSIDWSRDLTIAPKQ